MGEFPRQQETLGLWRFGAAASSSSRRLSNVTPTSESSSWLFLNPVLALVSPDRQASITEGILLIGRRMNLLPIKVDTRNARRTPPMIARAFTSVILLIRVNALSVENPAEM
jgi:hypothetical protein